MTLPANGRLGRLSNSLHGSVSMSLPGLDHDSVWSTFHSFKPSCDVSRGHLGTYNHPRTQHTLFSEYHVNPVLNHEAFSMEARLLYSIPLNTQVFGDTLDSCVLRRCPLQIGKLPKEMQLT